MPARIVTRAPLPGHPPDYRLADEARRDSACDSRCAALEQNRNIARCSGARGGGGLHATLSRDGSRRREGEGCRICKVLSKRTRASVKSAPLAERTRGPREPAVRVQVLAKRTRGDANGRCGDPGEIEALYLRGKIRPFFFPVVYNEGKILHLKVAARPAVFAGSTLPRCGRQSTRPARRRQDPGARRRLKHKSRHGR
jgi:hypothetical protein